MGEKNADIVFCILFWESISSNLSLGMVAALEHYTSTKRLDISWNQVIADCQMKMKSGRD